MGSRANGTAASFWGDVDAAEALERYGALLDAVDDGLFHLDGEGRFVGVNDGLVETTGYAREQLLGEHVSLVLDEAAVEPIERTVRDRLEAGAEEDPIEVDATVETADGDRRPCELRIDVLAEDGDRRGTTGVIREQGAVERSRTRSAPAEPPTDAITATLDEANVGVFVLDDAFDVAWVDETVAEYFGLDRDATVGRDKHRLVEERIKDRIATPERFAETVLATYDDNSYVERFECRLEPADDREGRRLEHYSRPIESGPYAGGRIELYYDVSDQHRRAGQLRRLNEAVREWIGADSREAVAERACTHLADVLGLELNGIYLRDESTERLRLAAWSDAAEALFDDPPEFTEEDSIAGRVYATGTVASYDDVTTDPNVYDPDTPIGSEIVLPIGDHGVVIVGSVETGAFDEAELNLAKLVAATLEVTFDEVVQRRRLETRTSELERELDEIYGRITDGFIALNEDWEFTHVNERARDLFGIDESVLGTAIWEIFPALVETAFEDHYRDAMATQEPVSFEAYYAPYDAWFEEHVYPSPSGLSIYFRDVTDRRERERELERTERRFEAIFDDPNILVGLLEPDGTVLDINETAMAYVDVDLADVVGEPFWETPWWGADEAVQRDAKRWTERAADGEYVDFEADLVRPDGEQFTISGNFRPVTDDDGDVVSIIVSDRDVTERKERERELERALDLLEKTERIADVAGWEVDPGTMEPYWSEHLFDLLDVSDDEQPSLDEALDVYHTDEDRAVVEGAIEEALETGEAIDVEVQFPRPEGGVGWLRIQGEPELEDGEVVSLRGALQDVTERKRRERRLEESNERLEQFAYAASHDLQEPLRMVSSYLQLLERRYADDLDADAEEFIAYAVDGAERMQAMIDGLLEYSRVETRGDPFEPVDLGAVLDDVVDDLQLQFEESDADLSAESLPTVEGDASQLRQVFQNLLDNAIEYSGDEPPRIDVTADRRGDEWLVSVADDGIGIDPDDQDRVFDVFDRLHAPDEHEGTGIGLALCERIVERHGGEVRADSEPGEGSTFTVTLPAVTDRSE